MSRPIVDGHPLTVLPYPILVLFSSTMIEKTRTITGLRNGRGDTWKINFYQNRDSNILCLLMVLSRTVGEKYHSFLAIVILIGALL
jgi:hypothetical protein